MTSVQELSILHRRYSEISHRFRAGWTFHQFLQSLSKALMPRVEDRYSDEFQGLYNGLKEVSENLNASDAERTRTRLDAIDQRLFELYVALDEEDSKVAPDFLRQFFRRVKNYDEKILTQLVKFYLYVQAPESWSFDRLDKVDFLLARLVEDEDPQTGEVMLRDHRRAQEILLGLWAQMGGRVDDPAEVARHRAAIDALRQETARVEGLDELSANGIIRRFRDLKHGLGTLFFEPSLLLAVQETNLALKNRVQRLYSQEERRIVAEYQRIFELEREVPFDSDLDRDLSQFREEIERFEQQLQREEFRLEEIAQIRQRVRSLLPRLTPDRSQADKARDRLATDTGEMSFSAAAAAASSPLSSYEDLIGDYYRKLMEALQNVNPPDLPAERVVLQPEIYSLRVEAREVEAYRRVFGRAQCDRELEQFLLEAASLRIRINEEAREIGGLLDETSATGDSVIFIRARLTARAADAFLWRFSHVLNELMLIGDLQDCWQVMLLRMRLMRDYSGLWLLAFKPLLKRHVSVAVA
jgi:hypothetical protein